MRHLAIAMLTLVVTACGSAAPKSETDQYRLQDQAAAALQSMLTKDPSLRPILDDAAGYAVLPDVGKAGLVVGGAHGRGVLYEKGGRFVGFVELQQASVGAQAGAQAYTELVVFRDYRDVLRVKGSTYTMGANLSAVVLTAGAGAEAQFNNGIAVFVEPKGGAMAELSLNGQRLKYAPIGG
jgi:lipid-binding SYLF domain-containing protein